MQNNKVYVCCVCVIQSHYIVKSSSSAFSKKLEKKTEREREREKQPVQQLYLTETSGSAAQNNTSGCAGPTLGLPRCYVQLKAVLKVGC
jgi:hypothetical protein